jgi:hypothetical protein
MKPFTVQVIHFEEVIKNKCLFIEIMFFELDNFMAICEFADESGGQ